MGSVHQTGYSFRKFDKDEFGTREMKREMRPGQARQSPFMSDSLGSLSKIERHMAWLLMNKLAVDRGSWIETRLGLED